MNVKLVELATRSGLSPKMAAVSQTMWDEIWAAIEKAQEQGIATGCIVSSLEVVKVTVINQYLGLSD